MKEAPDLWSYTAFAETWPVSLSGRSCCSPGTVPLVCRSQPPLSPPSSVANSATPSRAVGANQTAAAQPLLKCVSPRSVGPDLKAGSESRQPLFFLSMMGPVFHSPHALLFCWCFLIRCLRKLRRRRDAANSPQVT